MLTKVKRAQRKEAKDQPACIREAVDSIIGAIRVYNMYAVPYLQNAISEALRARRLDGLAASSWGRARGGRG